MTVLMYWTFLTLVFLIDKIGDLMRCEVFSCSLNGIKIKFLDFFSLQMSTTKPPWNASDISNSWALIFKVQKLWPLSFQMLKTWFWVEVERAHIFRARAALELPKSSPSFGFYIIEPDEPPLRNPHWSYQPLCLHFPHYSIKTQPDYNFDWFFSF